VQLGRVVVGFDIGSQYWRPTHEVAESKDLEVAESKDPGVAGMVRGSPGGLAGRGHGS